MSLPHTAYSSDVTMTSQWVTQRHVAFPLTSSTTHSAPNAQNFRSHDSEQHTELDLPAKPSLEVAPTACRFVLLIFWAILQNSVIT